MKQKIISRIQAGWVGFFNFILALFLLTSCGQIQYLITQGIGQLKIQTKAKDNQTILDNPVIKKEYKEKILQITKYKDFFYNYFKKRPTSIYSKTTLLETKAVSYLLIVSLSTKIEPLLFNFPIVGHFPYIGFFNFTDAINEKKKYDLQNYHTYLRPVYAYSTLGFMDDPILSSFFYFDEIELANLIFHELFHTIFFIKDEVGLNENMANYFANQLTLEYFKGKINQEKMLENEKKLEALIKKVVDLSKELNDIYSKAINNEHGTLLQKFLSDSFYPQIKSFCHDKQIGIDYCFPLVGEWNNARFSEFSTYEELQDILSLHHKKLGGSLYDFYLYLQQEENLNHVKTLFSH